MTNRAKSGEGNSESNSALQRQLGYRRFWKYFGMVCRCLFDTGNLG